MDEEIDEQEEKFEDRPESLRGKYVKTDICKGAAAQVTEDYGGATVEVVLVGDDYKHVVNRDTCTVVADDSFCHECGQFGCTHDGLDRSEVEEDPFAVKFAEVVSPTHYKDLPTEAKTFYEEIQDVESKMVFGDSKYGFCQYISACDVWFCQFAYLGLTTVYFQVPIRVMEQKLLERFLRALFFWTKHKLEEKAKIEDLRASIKDMLVKVPYLKEFYRFRFWNQSGDEKLVIYGNKKSIRLSVSGDDYLVILVEFTWLIQRIKEFQKSLARAKHNLGSHLVHADAFIESMAVWDPE